MSHRVNRRPAGVAVAAAFLLGLCMCPTARADATDEALAKLLDALPAPAGAEADAIAKDLVKLGPAGVKKLVDGLVEPGTGNDVQARYALHGLAVYVSRPGAEAERRMLAETLAKRLEGDYAPAVKGFLIRQLQIAGGSEAVAALGKCLLDEDQCEYASQALLAMGGERAVEPFRRALSKARGRIRVTLIQGLGVLRDTKSASALKKAAADSDRAVRVAAVWALGNIGDRSTVDTVLRALDAKDPYEHRKATDACLLLAQRLAEADRKKDAERIYARLWERRTEPEQTHLRCAALRGLVDVRGARAFDDIVAAMKSDDPEIRAVALDLAAGVPGEDVVRRWIEHMKKALPAERAGVLAILARLGDRSALPAVLEAMEDSDESVKLAAIEAAGAFGQKEAVERLVPWLGSAWADGARAARRALERIPGKAATQAMVQALESPAGRVRSALLEILAARGATQHVDVVLAATKDQDPPVRFAAFRAMAVLAGEKELPTLVDLLVEADDQAERQAVEAALAATCIRIAKRDVCAKPVVAAYKAAGVPARCALVRVLGTVAGAEALKVVRQALNDSSAEVRDAAVRVLAGWSDPQAMADLLEIAGNASNQTHQVLGLRGYIRLAAAAAGGSVDESLQRYQKAMDVARRPEEKRLALAGMAGVKSLKAMDAVLPHLQNAPLKEEAAAAVVGIARNIGNSYPEQVKSALKKVMETAGSDRTRKGADEVLRSIKQSEEFIAAWVVSGPYRQAGKNVEQLFDVAFPPEKPDEKVTWKPLGGMGWLINLGHAIGGQECAAYLRTSIWAPQEQEARLEIGSDDGVKAWLNGKLVHANNVLRGVTPGEDKADITLRKGWNTLMLKITQGIGGWGACARLTTTEGKPLEGLRADPTK